MTDILITKIRTGGNQMIRADSKGSAGSGSWINISATGIDAAIERAREVAAENAAIADELEKVRAQGVHW